MRKYRGLWGFVAGTETPIAETATKTNKNAYQLRSDKAYFLIASSGCMRNTAKTVRIYCSYEDRSIKPKIFAAAMKEEADIMDHLTYMTLIDTQLRELKEEISDQ